MPFLRELKYGKIRVMVTEELARVITLLDEIKSESEDLVRRTGYAAVTRIHSKATEAQNILIGMTPTDPNDN